MKRFRVFGMWGLDTRKLGNQNESEIERPTDLENRRSELGDLETWRPRTRRFRDPEIKKPEI